MTTRPRCASRVASALIATTDFFTPVVDDAYDWGRIAATNALSDVYAMGGRPVVAVNLLGWPRDVLPFELATETLRGGMDVCADAGCHLAGGHSVDDPEPKYGLAVTGIADPNRLLRNDSGKPGTPLSLTKPLGIGVLNSRHKATGERFPQAIDEMTTLNATPPPPRWTPASNVPRTSPDSACWGTCTSWRAPAASRPSSTLPPCRIWRGPARRWRRATSAAAPGATSTGWRHTSTCQRYHRRKRCCSPTRRLPAACWSPAKFRARRSSESWWPAANTRSWCAENVCCRTSAGTDAIMVEPNSVVVDNPVAEAVGTTGLILNVVAVIAFALCLAAMGTASAGFAIASGAVALVTFAASIAILIVDGNRSS